MKSEPLDYSIDDLERDGKERWDGVRNYQVRNMMRDDMSVGDKALFYHSNAGKDTGVAGESKEEELDIFPYNPMQIFKCVGDINVQQFA